MSSGRPSRPHSGDLDVGFAVTKQRRVRGTRRDGIDQNVKGTPFMASPFHETAAF
jgi:hypothetical protein